RIIVFDVGGYINLLTAVSAKGNLTIAGQTAPGGGIGFRGGEISFSSRSNVICRYIRIRPGSETASSTDDALAFANGRTMIFDHVSLEFAPWNNVGCVSSDWQNTPVTEVTFQNCINANPTGQQFGAHTESVSSTMSWFYTIFANSHNRNPLSKIHDIFVNNVLYNCSAGYTTHTSTTFKHDIVNNYFIAGPASGGNLPWYQLDANQSIYYAGNYYDGDKNGVLGGSLTTPAWDSSPGIFLSAPWSALTTPLTNNSAATAYRISLSQSGTFPRDQIDDLVLSQVKKLGSGTTGTGVGTVGPDGGLYTSQTSTGLGNNGYGVINGGAPATDTDGDGMPDYWESSTGLNSGGNDAMVIGASGYANIELYLNWLADPHATSISNAAVEIDLWPYTTGWTNVSPVYTAFAASNGVVVLTNSHYARFTPTAAFVGLGSFKFSVTGNDGTAWTNTVTVLSQASIAAGRNLIWRGDGVANLWNTNALNFIDDTGTPTAFAPGDSVTFDDNGSNTPAINLPVSVAAGKLFFVAAQDYTLTGGGITGAAALTKVGTGKLTLLNANAFSGGTTLNEGEIQLGDGVTINGSLSGNITNNDTLTYANPNTLATSANITGSGTLTKIGAGALTISGTQTFTNLTTVNAGTLQFSTTIPPSNITNNTLITFAVSGATVYSNIVSGPGVVAVNTSSGNTYLTGPSTFTGGLTNVAGNLILSNNTAAGSGPVNYVAGFVMVGGGCVVANDFIPLGSVTTDLMMQGTNGAGTWAGNVSIPSSAQWRPGADTGGSFVFTGNASIGNHFCVFPRGTITVSSNAVISAATSFLGRDSGGNNRSANITFRDNATAYLGLCNIGGGQAGAGVTVTVQNNANVSFASTNFDLQNINKTTAISSIRLNGGMFTVGYFTKTKTSQTNIIGFNGGILRASTSSAAFLPAFNVSTNYVQTGGAKIDTDTNTITIAAPLLHDPTLATADGGFTKLGSGTLTLSGAETFTGNVTVSNGTLVLTGSATLTTSSNLNVTAGVFDASALGGFTLTTGKIISGGGAVNGNFTVNSGAMLAPGNSVGTLTFSNNLTLTAGSGQNFELGTTSDRVNVTGALTLAGTVNVTNVAGFGAGTYTLFTAGSLSGSLTLGTTPGGYNYTLTNTPTAVQLVVVSTNTVPPVFSGVGNFSGNDLVFGGSNGAPFGNYFVLTSTNLTLPTSNWTRLLTNQFDANGNFNFTGSVTTNVLDNFYRLQLP
ncbi:MAG: hypothetical protein RL380_291, partial [Verrucomicrobiota bacterium]